MKSIKLTIIDIDQYIKRNDTKTLTWFSVPVDLLNHSDFFWVSGDEFKAFIYIISLFIKDKNEAIEVNIDHSCHVLHLNKDCLLSCINKFNLKRWQIPENIDILDSAYTSVQIRTEPYKSVPTNKHTNTQTPPNAPFPRTAKKASSDSKQIFVHELFDDEYTNEFVGLVNEKTQDGWIKTYGDIAFIRQDLKKAVTWIHANKNKAPKSQFAKFFSGWLSRSFENHRKTLNAQKGAAKDRGYVEHL